MQNINLSQIDQKYILNKQDTTSNPIETGQNAQQVKDGNNKMKKALAGLAIAGAVIAAGVGIYKGRRNKVIQDVNEIIIEVKTKLLKDIKFDKGIATLSDGSKFTGIIEDTLKNGDKIVLEYTDGILQKSTKTASNGTQIFEKVYSKAPNGDLLVNNKNITEISKQVRKHQGDFTSLMKKQDVSLEELKGLDRKYLSKNQIQELDLKIKAKEAEESARKQAHKAQERAVKEVQERAQGEVVDKQKTENITPETKSIGSVATNTPKEHQIWKIDKSLIEYNPKDNPWNTVDKEDYYDFKRFIDESNQMLRSKASGNDLGDSQLADYINKSCAYYDELYKTAIPTQKAMHVSRCVGSTANGSPKLADGTDLLDLLKKSKPGDIITPDSGYGFAFVNNSTPSRVHNQYKAREINYEILIPSGAKIPRQSSKEIILPRNAQYEVVDIKSKENGVIAYLKYILP